MAKMTNDGRELVFEPDDFGFEFVDSGPSEATVEDLKRRLLQMHKLIDPLLANLAANPEKDTIKWPNRATKIDGMRIALKTLIEGI